MIVARAEGLFGDLTIEDYAGFRRLLLGRQLQGAAYLSPSAADVVPGLPGGPGPVAASTYSLGWLIAGSQAPATHCLMAGLGCGEGVVGMLCCFPRMILTVVEIDPTVIALTLEHFPMVAHYVERGRLIIVNDSLEHYLDCAGPRDRFGLVCFDLSTGRDGANPLLLEPGLIERLRALGDDIWINLVVRGHVEAFGHAVSALRRGGVTVQQGYSTWPASANVIVAGQPRRLDTPDFEPYAGLADASVAKVREKYRRLCAAHVDLPGPC